MQNRKPQIFGRAACSGCDGSQRLTLWHLLTGSEGLGNFVARAIAHGIKLGNRLMLGQVKRIFDFQQSPRQGRQPLFILKRLLALHLQVGNAFARVGERRPIWSSLLMR